MMRIPAFIIFSLSVALSGDGACLAADAGAVIQPAPAAAVAPQPAQPMPVAAVAPDIQPPAVLAPAMPVQPPVAIPYKEAPAPAAGAFRSIHKAAPMNDPVSAPAGKPDSSSPDVVIGGLPGAKSVTSEKQP